MMPNLHRDIRILIAEDDDAIVDEYVRTFQAPDPGTCRGALDDLEDDLFGDETEGDQPVPDNAAFTVVTCAQGEKAIALHAESLAAEHPFDLALIDVRMPPGIDGVETAVRIRDRDPGLLIGIVTGQADLDFADIAAMVLPAERLFFVRKPFIRHEIRATVLDEIARTRNDPQCETTVQHSHTLAS